MAGMTAKQRRFIDEYLVDLNATQAAIRSGYSQKTAAEIGAENLRKPQIADAVKAAFDERAQRTEINQDYVLRSIVSTMERCKAPADFNPTAVLRGTEQLGRHFGMFKERLSVESPDGGPLEVRFRRD